MTLRSIIIFLLLFTSQHALAQLRFNSFTRKLDYTGAGTSFVTVPFSSTPTFNVANGSAVQITLTGDVTLSTLTGALTGQIIAFLICQDGVGNHAFAWPVNFVNPGAVAGTASSCTKQIFVYDGTNANAETGPIVTGTTLNFVNWATSAAPGTPTSGSYNLYIDSTNKSLFGVDDAGNTVDYYFGQSVTAGNCLKAGTTPGSVADFGATCGGTPTAHTLSSALNCVAASASGTTYTCTTSPSITPASGDMVLFKADVANTGSSTLNVNAAGAKTIKKVGGGTNLVANDLLIGTWTLMMYDGTNWQDMGALGNAPAGSGGATVTVYNSGSNTYTKPAPCNAVEFLLWGGGGSGAGGQGASNGAVVLGGSGGGGGARVDQMVNCADLAATATVVVGSGGAAVAAGASGNAGNPTTVTTNSIQIAYAGGGGAGFFSSGTSGTSGGSGGGDGQSGVIGLVGTTSGGTNPGVAGAGGSGGAGGGCAPSAAGKSAELGGGAGGGVATNAANAGGSAILGGPGGGAGAPVTSGNVAANGAAGGAPQSYVAGGGGAGGALCNTNACTAGSGTAGTAGSSKIAGSGGGGGGSCVSTTASGSCTAGSGAAGATPSAGGGGGGAASTNAGTSTAGGGGAGGNGLAIVIQW